MAVTTQDVRTAIAKIQAGLAPVSAEMNELDGRMGDGDLGVTLENGFNNISDEADNMPEDVGMALFGCAKQMTKASGSSFGTLMATALMAAGNLSKGKTELTGSDMPDLLQAAQDAMISRGGASLGDKTILDSMDSIITALKDAPANAAKLQVAEAAATDALDTYRDKPNKIGRARIFGEKTIGLDDPGMVAILRLISLMS
jgi:dihydroxyacetone kinase-like protein